MPNPLPISHILQGEKGKYQIKRVIKSGGMGIVYEAIDISFKNKICAVKEMLDNILDTDELQEAIRKFDREAELLATLNHPSIPQISDHFRIPIQGTKSYRHYIVMQYFAGQNLEELIAERIRNRQGPFPEVQVIKWTTELCDILTYMHAQKVVYRDMKPSNIIKTDSGRLALIDFGIATILQPGQKGMTRDGTKGFAAPEQYDGKSEWRSDFYGLGATMHYLLTLRDPEKEKPFDFPPVRTLNPSVSEQTEAAIKKALEYDVNLRYRSAQEFKEALTATSTTTTPFTVTSSQCVCSACGHSNPLSSQYCEKCGASLGVGSKQPKVKLIKRLLNWIKRKPIVATIVMLLTLIALSLGAKSSYDWYSLNSSYYLTFSSDSLVVYNGKPGVSKWGFPKKFWTTVYSRSQISDNYKRELDKGALVKAVRGDEKKIKDEVLLNDILKRLTLIEQGKYYYEKGQYQKCIDTLLNYPDNGPDKGLANYFVGMSYFFLPDRDVESATRRLMEAREEGVPDSYSKELQDSINRLASFWRSKARKAFYENNNSSRAEEYLKKSLSLDASSPPKSLIQFELGMVYEKKRDIRNAIKQYELAKEQAIDGSQRAKAADRLGCIYMEDGKYKDAKREFEEAIRYAPSEYSRDSYDWTGVFTD